ncbi:hypothetical protein M2152_002768 [Microbacteriaceae bacterium SG_E_30_P1]|uniref:Uncharacterized protein n=1 Tax=Antiquaquibacter oligotrophicus TaxID=2880260 RepID=A0ABT6KRI3_9MICO|nr:hypothetical protein [Antiquaquibacter oligotrophicus]MDH6182586.1 hypothetical protein [Antiquaquibacter oligotrophicus]UDF14447.1 hypothetical protein LH407_06195 [Antiquaquibacter oligotrophicus]
MDRDNTQGTDPDLTPSAPDETESQPDTVSGGAPEEPDTPDEAYGTPPE